VLCSAAIVDPTEKQSLAWSLGASASSLPFSTGLDSLTDGGTCLKLWQLSSIRGPRRHRLTATCTSTSKASKANQSKPKQSSFERGTRSWAYKYVNSQRQRTCSSSLRACLCTYLPTLSPRPASGCSRTARGSPRRAQLCFDSLDRGGRTNQQERVKHVRVLLIIITKDMHRCRREKASVVAASSGEVEVDTQLRGGIWKQRRCRRRSQMPCK